MSEVNKRKSEEAFNIYKENDGTLTLKDIGQLLGVDASVVRGWKHRHKWDKKLNLVPATKVQRKKEEKLNVEKVERVKKEYNWVEVESVYISDMRMKPITLKQVSEEYNIPYATVTNYATVNDWTPKRQSFKDAMLKQIADTQKERQAERVGALLGTADSLMGMIEQALMELRMQMVTEKSTQKTEEAIIEKGKVVGKTITTNEKIEVVTRDALIDRMGIRQLAGALKDIKEIYSILGNVEEQRVRIANMQKQIDLNKDDGEDETGVVMIPTALPESEMERNIIDV